SAAGEGSAPAAASASAAPAPARPRERPVVVLDPGHGAEEVGAAAYGVVERDSNLDFALRAERLLLAHGVDVVVTRRSEGRAEGAQAAAPGFFATRADLLARVRTANAAEGDVFVSIHSNGSADPSLRGVEVYYDSHRPFGAENLALAQQLIASTHAALAEAGFWTPSRGVFDAACWRSRSGRCVGLYVLSPEGTTTSGQPDPRVAPAAGATPPPTTQVKEATMMPGALVELLFISNPEDAALLRSDAAREALARGLVAGILAFLGL
ncbi:MAG: N-acetylmuramoyl-L-alanine amidase, partial [Chloroflexi bacterium]|nr:N-acetylmuramoyl-L-alanine amidase [Chloroflexota bacterium]